MAKRLIPTGKCWCGCGVDTEVGSFFLVGHDKKAEARVIKDVFGSVPEFLVAFGYGPDSAHTAGADWTEAALRLAALSQTDRTGVELEYARLEDRTGPLTRTTADCPKVEVPDGSAVFHVPNGLAVMTVTIPFADLVTVYRDQRNWVVRISGALKMDRATGNTGRVDYIKFA